MVTYYENDKVNKSGHSNLLYLNEISRKNLVGKTKSQSPARYVKRLGYRAKGTDGIDPDQLINNDVLVTAIPIGDYTSVIAFPGVLHALKNVLARQPRPNVTLQTVIRAVTRAFDDTDVKVDCTCADFKYRYAYWATRYGYKWGPPENRPSKITNPDDVEGAMCKHLTALLANKRWLVKVASLVNDFIKAYPDEVRKKLGLDEDEFIINPSGIHTPKPKDKNNVNKPRDIERPDNKQSEEPSQTKSNSESDLNNEEEEGD